jgi:replicative DNA helicase
MQAKSDQKGLSERLRAAEENVLGSMIKEPSHISEVARMLSRDSFYDDAHQTIFRAITSLYDEQKPVDSVTVADRLYDWKQVDNIGGYGLIAHLLTVSGTTANVLSYCEIVLEHWKRRKLTQIAQQMIADAQGGGDIGAVFADAEKAIVEASEYGTDTEVKCLRDTTDSWLSEIDERCARRRDGEEIGGIPTGFVDLDRRIGGLKPAELTILAARPSVGKTALALSMAYKMASRHLQPVAFFSLEQRDAELKNRMATSFGGVNGENLRDGNLTDHDVARLQTISTEFRQTSLYFIDKFSQSILSIAANARRLKRRASIAAIVIDYLQLVTPENRREQRHEQVASMSRRLKGLARELEIPVLCLAQINRQSENRTDGKPRMSDLRESGAIEQDADVIIMMHRPGDKDDPAPAHDIQLLIEKNRNGPTGLVTLQYEPAFVRFSNRAMDYNGGH